ncbi:MAG TPA: gliding motility-associated C-terminal domain-containing protein [Flavobacteriales bacterium]|nr:gliding motility-associated C-terminal domain-containing protein [Flavobacteriales bacterium]
MKDSLNSLFRDRFQGHEMPVDPGVWHGITQQMANTAATTGADGVSELFKQRFQGHETAVDPRVWQGISAQLGHTVVGTTTGSSLLGWAAAGIVAVTVGTVAYFSMGEPKTTASVAVPSTPTQQVTPNIVPGTVVAEVGGKTSEPMAQGPAVKRSAATRDREVSVQAEPSSQPAAVASDPVLSITPDATVQPTLPTKEGTAVVESIIADITSEVKQQVLEQRDRAQTTDPGQPSNGQAPTEPESEMAAMPELFVPNIFTPNGDGPNDVYQISAEGFDQVLLRVYSVKDNRLVFSTNNNQEHWTGANCEDGMYLVAVEARTPDGRTATEGKVVWLNRNP